MAGAVELRGLETIRATLVALNRLEPEMRSHVAAVMGRITPDFQRTVQRRAAASPQRRVLGRLIGDTAQIVGDDYTLRMEAGHTGGPVSPQRLNPLTPPVHARMFEFGSGQRNATTKYGRRSPKGHVHVVTRHATRQMPARSRTGWAFYPSTNDIRSRALALWFQTAVRTLHEAFERR